MSPIKPLITALLAALSLPSTTAGTAAPAAGEYPETSVCGVVREPMAFWSWSRMAGRSSPEAGERHANAERIRHETRDGRVLQGFRLNRLDEHGDRPAILVAQGNAMLAEHLLDELQHFARAGFDVWVFDYRGYGASDGKPRLQAIVGDYLELHERVSDTVDRPPHLYGISFGGIVLMNVIGRGADYERGVIDGSPARASAFGCPTRFDPAEHFPVENASILVISGHEDSVVPLRQTRELLELAEEHGGRAVVREDFNHPFMDRPEVHGERRALINDFLLGAYR